MADDNNRHVFRDQGENMKTEMEEQRDIYIEKSIRCCQTIKT